MSGERVRDISEFALIERLRFALPEAARNSDALVLSIGDDAAVARVTNGELLVVTADTLTEGIHFRSDWTTWNDIGHKALAVNLSDLGAMGARPVLVTVSMSLTGDERVSDLESLYKGLGACAASFGCVVAGGDITRTSGPLSVAVTAIGESVDGKILRRDAAEPGDDLWVTGSIGAGAAGLALERLPLSDPRRLATTAGVLREALHRPVPRILAGQRLAGIGVRCAMDLSDGLAGDLHKILQASRVDAEIASETLPIPAAVHALFPAEATRMAMHGGDDYELLFTAAPGLREEIAETLARAGTSGTIIGRIVERAGEIPRLIARDEHGAETDVVARGFDHFG